VEQYVLSKSAYGDLYEPVEKQRTIVVDSFPELGRISAWRFLEWVQQNPDGVCSLPTGKTPEYFIKWVQKILAEWDTPEMQSEVKKFGLESEQPDLSGLYFVQIDEFYPIKPSQHNSFYHYVVEYYIKGFGLDPSKALLMDLTRVGLEEGETLDSIWPDNEVNLELRKRLPNPSRLVEAQHRVLQAVDQWCVEYEQKIRDLGGIGFFMGGIGPDGHIAFNCAGSSHFSTTRLCKLNYESQAAASGDLGGMAAASKNAVITIGLGTICYNDDATILTCAAGEAKAKVVANAIQADPNVMYPATALRKCRNSVFFITKGAAKLCVERTVSDIKHQEITPAVVERVLTDLSMKCEKRLMDLTEDDVRSCSVAKALFERIGFEQLHKKAVEVRDTLISKIHRGMEQYTNTRFLHTEPHHDDIMLGYLPMVMRLSRDTSNYHLFTCATSGFNSVSNNHMLTQLDRVDRFLETNTFEKLLRENYFAEERPLRRQDVYEFLDGVADNNQEKIGDGASRRFIRNIIHFYNLDTTKEAIKNKCAELRKFINSQYSGAKDPLHMQTLKGMCREWEAECLWGYIGWNVPYVRHLRLGFYTSDIFTPEPTPERDMMPTLKILKEANPDIVTVALDPEASGPDTHYKVLQAVTAAVERYADETGKRNLKIWGYRNVWYRFMTSECTTMIPVNLETMAAMDHMFINSFESQKAAEFPSPELDGPFSDLSRRVQVDQYRILQTCLGRQWFFEHKDPMIRATRGFVFLREMDCNDLISWSRSIKSQTQGA
jgi:glucosamine-6-phosphate deaminase